MTDKPKVRYVALPLPSVELSTRRIRGKRGRYQPMANDEYDEYVQVQAFALALEDFATVIGHVETMVGNNSYARKLGLSEWLKELRGAITEFNGLLIKRDEPFMREIIKGSSADDYIFSTLSAILDQVPDVDAELGANLSSDTMRALMGRFIDFWLQEIRRRGYALCEIEAHQWKEALDNLKAIRTIRYP